MAGQIWVAFQVAVRYARIIGSGLRCCKPDKEPRYERTLPCDRQKGKSKCYRDAPVEITLMFKIQVDIVVSKVPSGRSSKPQSACCTPATSASAGYLSPMLKISCASAPVKRAALRCNQFGFA